MKRRIAKVKDRQTCSIFNIDLTAPTILRIERLLKLCVKWFVALELGYHLVSLRKSFCRDCGSSHGNIGGNNIMDRIMRVREDTCDKRKELRSCRSIPKLTL